MTVPDPGAAPVPYRLRPFPGEPAPEGLRIQGSAARAGDRLILRYVLSGPLQQLRIQEPGPTPRRRDGLWQTTCLECFLARPEDPGYWEVNLSPSGDWNVYRFDGYRQALRPEATGGAPSLRRLPGPEDLELAMALPLPPPLAASDGLELGITAVIATGAGELSYWALDHPGPEPDFHRREAFLLRL